MDATMTLVDRLKNDKHRGFHPRARYYSHGDFVTYFATEARCHARRVNSLVTVYVDTANGDLVGCKVKGVKRLLENLKSFGVVATDGNRILGMLFLSAAAIEEERKNDVLELSRRFGKTELPASLPQETLAG